VPGDRFIELAQSEDRHVLDVLFRHAREAVMVQDRSGRIVYANDRAAELVGLASGAEMAAVPAGELSLSYEMVDESGGPIGIEDLPARKVLSGEDAPEMTVGYRARGSLALRWARINSSPIKNDAGEVVWAVSFLLDITEQVRQREGDRVLSLVNEALATSVTVEENLAALTDVLSNEVAAFCGIHLVDHRGDLVLATSSSQPGAGVAQPISLGSDRLQARVMKTGSPEVVTTEDDLSGEDLAWMVGDPDFVASSGIRSVVCLPLGAGPVAGTMTLARDRSRPVFDASDLELLRRVSGAATVGLANARLFELEHETAEALRAGLTPATVPEVEGLQLAARYLPLARFGHIGGDFFDVVPLSRSECVVLVGDIEGKGVPAAAAVGMARDTMRATVKLRSEPEVVLTQLNDALQGQEHPRMCTVAYLRVHKAQDGANLRISLAGHPPPALLTAAGALSFPGKPCPPAGVLPSITPTEIEVSMAAGDTLLLYTDGFAIPTETPMETVSRFVSGGETEDLEELLDRMLHDLRDSVESFRDDILLLALRIP
jgi:serine phosphatase RsbU (regulator of sigma subunit)